MLNRLFICFILCIFGFQAYSNRGYYYRAFWSPIYKKHPLAWCLADGGQCGREPARRYCREMGYEKLARFRPARERVQTSDAIDRKDICQSGYCKTYQVIFCKNRFGPFS